MFLYVNDCLQNSLSFCQCACLHESRINRVLSSLFLTWSLWVWCCPWAKFNDSDISGSLVRCHYCFCCSAWASEDFEVDGSSLGRAIEWSSWHGYTQKVLSARLWYHHDNWCKTSARPLEQRLSWSSGSVTWRRLSERLLSRSSASQVLLGVLTVLLVRTGKHMNYKFLLFSNSSVVVPKDWFVWGSSRWSLASRLRQVSIRTVPFPSRLAKSEMNKGVLKIWRLLKLVLRNSISSQKDDVNCLFDTYLDILVSALTVFDFSFATFVSLSLTISLFCIVCRTSLMWYRTTEVSQRNFCNWDVRLLALLM